MKRGLLNLGIILLASFIIPAVSAEIFIGQTDSSVYNVGDILKLNMTLSTNIKRVDFLSVSLACAEGNKEIYKSIHTVQAGEQKQVNIELGIEPLIISDLKGKCFIDAVYGSEREKSREFEITDKVNVKFDIDGVVFSPKDKLKISGNAIKFNGQQLKGFVKIDINEINLSISEKVTDGKFEANFVIPDNAVPGSYDIEAKAYEKGDSGNIINQGNSINVIRIKQIIKGVYIDLNNISLVPGNEFPYTIIVYDQAGSRVIGDVEVVISKSDKSIFMKKLVKSGIPNIIFIESNYTPGYWGIDAKIEGIQESKVFLIEELKKVSFLLDNSTLIVENIGNVLYDKPVEISISGVTEVKNLNLGVGEKKLFRLGAPNGEYEISASDGRDLHNLGKVFLTGRAIGIDEIGNVVFGKIGIFIWSLLIVILVIIVLVLIRKIIKRSYVGKTPKLIVPLKKITTQQPLGSVEFKQINKPETSAMATVVDRGIKQEAAIVTLKIKNLDALQKVISYDYNPLEDIDKSLLEAKSAGAKIYVDGDYRTMIFAPMITKTQNNEIGAVIIAKEIESILMGHNKFSPQKIEFGIGVHSGEMAIETHEGKFRFASLGNTIAIAKRLAEQSQGEALMSEAVHKKTLGKVKVDKITGTGFWKIKQITDRTEYEDFIQRFLNRQRR